MVVGRTTAIVTKAILTTPLELTVLNIHCALSVYNVATESLILTCLYVE